MELVEKAWRVNTNKLEQPWFVPDNIYYGETRNEVKYKVDKSDLIHYITGEEPTYIELSVIRAKEYDKYLVDGVSKTKHQIEEEALDKAHKDRLRKILVDHPTALAYIYKRGSYYRPNHCGYTNSTMDAGIYPVKEAVNHVLSCDRKDDMDVIVINTNAHNDKIKKQIEELENKIKYLLKNLL